MGHQVSFFVMPGDLPQVEVAIRAVGEACFLDSASPACEIVRRETIAAGPATGTPGARTLFIARHQDLPAVTTRFSRAQDCWFIDAAESPVIEFSHSLFTGTKLTRGRAYFGSGLRFRPELPNPDFVRWGDRVLSRIRKQLTRHPELAPPWLYFGASALRWIHSSGATLTGGATAFHDA